MSDDDAGEIRLITDTASLQAACQTLAKGDYLALDTEFHRETTYWPQLCLVQAATDEFDVLVDPLAPGIDLAPLLALIADRSKTKVFHAARQDLEIFSRIMGEVPSPIFDTQIAAMACGLGDSISYENLVSRVVKGSVDKSSQFTDWMRRPLSDKQLAYARGDVTYLRRIYKILRDRLIKLERLDWIEDEHAALVDPEIYAFDPQQSWKRLKLRKFKPDYLAVLAAVAAWREQVAQETDKPRGRILKDDAIQEIAQQKPRSGEAIERLRAVPTGFSRSRHGQSLVATINAALDNPSRYAPDIERQEASGPPPGALTELLKVLLKQVADDHGVAPRLIANSADVERIAREASPDVAALKGWRAKVFGDQAQALKSGKLALAASPDGVRVIEV
ncbi:MAG: ribonuclease D [Alphaproteobacteria bacterium]|nr:ribonuclease D [Alphaproteobacteria bacterium]